MNNSSDYYGPMNRTNNAGQLAACERDDGQPGRGPDGAAGGRLPAQQ
jgi:hypothetical protein